MPNPALLLALLAATPAAAPAQHDLMPAPVSLRFTTGRLAVGAGFRMAAAEPCDERVLAGLGRLARALGRHLGRELPAPTRAASRPGLRVVCAPAPARVQQPVEQEAYAFEITPRGAVLHAESSLAALHGLETLRQLVRSEDGKLYLPAAVVEDAPRFPWRGLLLDVSRHFMPVEVVKRTLDGMAAVKLNVLHWHLSDDQGFRVESLRFPKLTGLGSDGLFYTQAQVRELIAYARERGIRLMPEFDVPGHATAWLVGHPELATLPGPYTIERRWGIFDPTLDPTREETYAFLDALFGEMAALFPDPAFHIGGDEVTDRHWNQSARVRAFVAEHGLRDNPALHARFNARLVKILEAHGKRVVGWDEVLHEELPRSTIVQSWRGTRALAEAAARGFETLLSNGYYLDHMQTAATHYAADPLPEGTALDEAARKRVLGGEACMWAEFVTPETVDSRIWPRAAAIAERLWSPASVRDAADMYRRLAVQSLRLEERGLTHRSGYEPMLRRLTGGAPTDALRTLADLVEPVKLYRRGRSRAYTQQTPLDRLVDAARPESDAARAFREAVDALLLRAPAFGSSATLREPLARWAASHAALDPQLARSEPLAELRPLSRNLSALAQIAESALDALEAGRAPGPAWRELAASTLADARVAHAELELAILHPAAKLALAAERLDRLATLGAAAWNAELEAGLKPRPRAE
ncbi:MAG: beta-N-acetylhexosaminidase [Vicinamibacteria bacterium]